MAEFGHVIRFCSQLAEITIMMRSYQTGMNSIMEDAHALAGTGHRMRSARTDDGLPGSLGKPRSRPCGFQAESKREQPYTVSNAIDPRSGCERHTRSVETAGNRHGENR